MQPRCLTSALIRPSSTTLVLVTELRLNGKTEDGLHLSLHDNDGNEFTVRVSDTLRATVNQQRLMSVPTTNEPIVSIKEVQRLLRAGQTTEQIARDNNISIEKIERFAGPIISERIYIIDQAQQIAIRKEGGRDPVTLLGVVISRLAPRNIDSSELSWDSWRLEDGTWTIELHYPNNTGVGIAQWNFDATLRTVVSMDENARWMMGDEPAPRQLPTAGLVPTEASHPSERRIIDVYTEFRKEVTEEEIEDIVEEIREVPRLAVIREEPDDEASRDGITARAKVPSWDEIMFGIKPEDK
ncbi:MAG: hypothetical protein CK523_04440 [Actinobacteria bacterium]|nr:MAG: hypothetical protein CK523_04440 [Actinomycetota bacterium]